ncbi:MAG: hypothetical protein IJ391_03195 [Clostridia bacterium]|nr:hypothetical protein [Clostridia bacterium]
MTNTKRALFLSVVSMFLCIVMLASTTFAWFTDSVESTGNIIKTGELKVTMEYSTDNADWKDASTGAIFNYQLWEPGYTDVKYVKVTNAGNLALKYKLDILPLSTSELKLADVIDVYYAIVDTSTGTVTRDNMATKLTKAGTLASLIADADGVAHGVILPKEGSTTVSTDAIPFPAYAQEEDVTICLALKMQESAGNDYQNISVGNGFTVRLFATQFTYEEDSFDHLYDENSEYKTAEKWDGTIAATLEADANGVYHITNASELAYINTILASIPTETAIKVVLDADIDLANISWTPIGSEAHSFTGTFDGQGHTIYNVNVTTSGNAGEVGDAGLFGVVKSYGTIKNLNLKNVTVDLANGERVGGLVGKTLIINIENCHVTNATISGESKVGGLVGDVVDATVSGCSVTNVSITADERAAALIGRVRSEYGTSKSAVKNNSAKDSTVYADSSVDYYVGQNLVNVDLSTNTNSNVKLLSADNAREVNLGGGNFVYVDKTIGSISSGRIENMLATDDRIQVAADFAAAGVTDLAVNIITADGTVLTTITPEGYSIPADGNIGIVDQISQESWTTVCATILDDSSSWQHTEWTPSVDAEPAIMVLYVNGEPAASCDITKNEFGTWADVVAAVEEATYGTKVADGVYSPAAKTYNVTNKAGLMNIGGVVAAASPSEANILTVNLLDDVDLDGEAWTPIDSMWITFNGNGHTISNIDCGRDSYVGRSGFWGYAGAVTINDLTLENVTSEGTQAGTFAGSADGLKINNCYLKGTNSITWSQNPAGSAYIETASGIGAVTGVTINSNMNVVIDGDVTVNYNSMDTVLEKIDNLIGYKVEGYSTNSGTITVKGNIG